MRPALREQLDRIVGAGHPDHALVGMPVGALRELLQAVPIATVATGRAGEARA